VSALKLLLLSMAMTIVCVSAYAQDAIVVKRPPVGTFAQSAARDLSSTRRSLGGAKKIVLADSVSVRIALHGAKEIGGAAQRVFIVLDDVTLAQSAQRGGFFYNVYVDLPESGDANAVKQAHFAGTLGAFELAAARQQGSHAIEYDITNLLSNPGVSKPDALVVSFVRVSGPNTPAGANVSIGELRVETRRDAH
jgi:tyrosinase